MSLLTSQTDTRMNLSSLMGSCPLSLCRSGHCGVTLVSPLVQTLQSPYDSSRDEEDDGSKEEREALHEVEGCRVEGVKDATAHQITQALHTGNRSKKGTLL